MPDDDSLNKSMLTYDSPGADGKVTPVEAFLATPMTEAKRGGVIVVQEIFGLNDHIKDVACRLAHAGYNALAINFFTREGDPPALSGGFEPLREFVGKIPDRQVMADIRAGVAYLRSRAA